MSWMRSLASALVAACALLAFANANVWAAGPSWLVDGARFDCEKATEGARYKTLLECLGGERSTTEEKWERNALASTSGKLLAGQGASFEAVNTSKFKLKAGSEITLECDVMSSTGTLDGGPPAKSHLAIVLKDCSVEGRSEGECHVSSAGRPVGTIATDAESEVVYLGTKKEAEKEEGLLGELYVPEQGEVFATIVIDGTDCPTFSKGEQELKGNVIAEIEPINSMAKTETTAFPSTSIDDGWRWVSKGKVEEILAVGLHWFGIIEMVLTGEAEAQLESSEEWGVTTK